MQFPAPMGSQLLDPEDLHLSSYCLISGLVDNLSQSCSGSVTTVSRTGGSDHRCQPSRLGAHCLGWQVQGRWGPHVLQSLNCLEWEAGKHALLAPQPVLQGHAVKVLSNKNHCRLRVSSGGHEESIASSGRMPDLSLRRDESLFPYSNLSPGA